MFSDIVGLYAAYPAWFVGSVLVIGLMVGSFLNVVIYRLPIMMEREWREQSAELNAAAAVAASVPPAAPAAPFTLATPGSACPSCKTPIKPVHNIPVMSWLA